MANGLKQGGNDGNNGNMVTLPVLPLQNGNNTLPSEDDIRVAFFKAKAEMLNPSARDVRKLLVCPKCQF